MNAGTTALILIGYQNEYFAKDGILHGVIEESLDANQVLGNTLALLNELRDQDVLIVSTPICFTHQYEELGDAEGILKIIKDAGAFKADTHGAEPINELKQFGDRILEVPGKRGLNSFSNTELNKILLQHNIRDVVIAGAITSICVDTTGRSAQALGYRVSILSDCCAGRTAFEQDFYCESIFPLYAEVFNSRELLGKLKPEGITN